MQHDTDIYREHCKPKLAELMRALGLDRTFVRAQGSYLYDAEGNEFTDFVGGFGAAIFGHNPAFLKAELIAVLNDDVPIQAQVSVRSGAAILGKRLNAAIAAERGEDGQGYYTHLSNSGAEAVEAAIKHAYFVRFDKLRRRYEQINRVIHDFCSLHEGRELHLDLPGNYKQLHKFREDLEEANLAQFERFQMRPVIAALKGSFHGKTASALKTTFNKSYREPFEGLSAIETRFFDMAAPERLSEIATESTCEFRYPVLKGDRVELRGAAFSRLIALILEPILGEGGIRLVPDASMYRFAEITRQHEIPVILDEIQTGCGRVGRIFAFTDTPLRKVEPEYVVLSKSLGGGMVKIGATMIRRDTYEEDFGILHSSTFAEDDLSSLIASSVIDNLMAEGGRKLLQVKDIGAGLRDRLEGLQRRFPNIIREVRGRGLMLGLEFSDLANQSPFFRAAAHQGVLSLLVSSFVLHHFGIRLLAPLTTMLKGNPGKLRKSILRIQPPMTITETDIDRLIAALTSAMICIERNNEFCLFGHLSGQRVGPDELADPHPFPALWPTSRHDIGVDARCAFVVHPTKLEHLVEYYFPSFRRYGYNAEGLSNWWSTVSRFLEPAHTLTTHVRSNAFILENNLIFVPYLAEDILCRDRPIIRREICDKIQDAVTVAKELGDDNIPTSMVGLGAYTSIATDNGTTVNDFEVPVTTGNAYTAALVIQSVEQALFERQIAMDRAHVAIVGAGGNIGMVLAQLMAPHVGSLTLVGRKRPGSRFKLDYARRACLREVLGSAAAQHAGGALASLLRSQFVGTDGAIPSDGDIDQIATAIDAMPACSRPIRLSEDLEDLATADLVISTTSGAEALVRPDHVKSGAIVCSASVPGDLSPDFFGGQDRNLAFQGGLARLPGNSTLDFVGMPGGGLAYGCIAETLVLAFEGENRSFAKGPISPDQVRQIAAVADKHGFCLGDVRLPD